MPEVIRQEDWIKDIDGMKSTCIVDVYAGNIVHVGDVIAKEFEMEQTSSLRWYVDQEWAEHPYAYVRERLQAAGYSRADS